LSQATSLNTSISIFDSRRQCFSIVSPSKNEENCVKVVESCSSHPNIMKLETECDCHWNEYLGRSDYQFSVMILMMVLGEALKKML
jgi:hypothetical protein